MKRGALQASFLIYSTTDLRRRGPFFLWCEVWCSGVGRACRLLAQRASPPIGARGQSTKNLHPDSQAVEVFHLAVQQGQAEANIAHVLTMDEARHIAANIARLPREAVTPPVSSRINPCRGHR